VLGHERDELAHDARDDDRTRALLGEPGERAAEQLRQPIEDVVEDRDVERLLRRPVVVQARDVDAGLAGDLARARPLEAAGREDGFGRGEDAGLGRSRRLPGKLERRLPGRHSSD
jgi:hypothetical protein